MSNEESVAVIEGPKGKAEIFEIFTSGKLEYEVRFAGQAQKFKANQAHLEFIPLDADDKPQPGKAYTAGVNEDGSFEVLASGGELPPGKYQVTITARGANLDAASLERLDAAGPTPELAVAPDAARLSGTLAPDAKYRLVARAHVLSLSSMSSVPSTIPPSASSTSRASLSTSVSTVPRPLIGARMR